LAAWTEANGAHSRLLMASARVRFLSAGGEVNVFMIVAVDNQRLLYSTRNYAEQRL
jgi:hypothetical protein